MVYPTVKVTTKLVDRLVKNIVMRSNDKNLTQKAFMTPRVNHQNSLIPIGTQNKRLESAKTTTLQYDERRNNQKFESLSLTDNNRDGRVLRKHNQYIQTWSNQMTKSIEARSSLQGRSNVEHQAKDVTLAEKVEGEIKNNREIRKVIATGFALTRSSHT